MERIIKFLEDFFKKEVDAIKASDIPDLNDFNRKLEEMNQFLSDPLKNRFGMIPMEKLDSPEYYESVKDFPAPDKRFLFRIDEYETSDKKKLYICYTSNYNPDGWKSYFNCFIIGKINNEFKIFSKFNYSDRGMGGDKKWFFSGGEEQYMQKINGEYLLNKDSLGKQISIHRILEPSNDADSMKEYNKD